MYGIISQKGGNMEMFVYVCTVTNIILVVMAWFLYNKAVKLHQLIRKDITEYMEKK